MITGVFIIVNVRSLFLLILYHLLGVSCCWIRDYVVRRNASISDDWLTHCALRIVTVLIWIYAWVLSLERDPNRYHLLKGHLVYTFSINYYLLLVVRDHLLIWILVYFSDIMNHKARPAWELYLKMETSGESFSLLQLIANDCYKVSCKIRPITGANLK